MAAAQQDQAGAVDFAAAVRGAGLAVGVGVLGALAVGVAPLLGPATTDGQGQGGGQPAAALLAALLVVLVPLLAGVLLRGGRLAGAVGVLTGGGAVAGALAVLDLQLFVRALDANRLELVRPEVVAELHPGPGAWAVLVGHLLLAGAALACARSVRRSGVLDDPDAVGDGQAAGEGPVLGRAGAPAVLAATTASLVLAGALFAAPLTSTDPVVLVPAVVQAPVAVLLGTALVAVVVLVGLALALVSGSVSRAAGVLAGVGLGALGLVVPRWVAGALEDGVGVGVGSVVGSLAALALAGSAVLVLVAARRRAARPAVLLAQPEAALPGPRVLHLVTALSGLLAGVLAVVGALLPVLSTTGGVAEPQIAQSRVLLLAGVVLAACCAGMLGGFAATLRPVVGVAWVVLVLGGSGVLQAVLVATDVGGLGWGPGAVLAVLAVLAAGVCAVASGLAGAAERDDVDTSEAADPARVLVVLASVAGVAVALGLALPLYSAPGFSSAALLRGGWGWDSWGLAVTAVVLLAAVAVAVRARPERAVAVLAGAALVAAVHLASWPLTAGRVVGASVGAGVPLTAVAVLALVATAVRQGRVGTPPLVEDRGDGAGIPCGAAAGAPRRRAVVSGGTVSAPIRVLVAKPGLDGHDRGAKVVARALRDAGMEVVYTGLHQTPEQIVDTALQEDADVIGLSVLSGAHMTLFAKVCELLAAKDASDVVVFGGGIIPEEDIPKLAELGVAQVFTPGATTTSIVDWVRANVTPA